MTAVVESIPTVLHVAVVLFILGLIQFLFSVNLIVARAVLGTFLLLVSLYFVMTILSIIWAECPYRTPFSVLVRYPVIWPMKLTYKILNEIYSASDDSLLEKWSRVGRDRLDAITPEYNLAVSREKKAQDLSSKASKHRIDRELRWTIDSLTTDSELEPFVASLPSLLSASVDQNGSQEVSNAIIAIFTDYQKFTHRIVRLLHTCIPPTILSDVPRINRATVCLQAINAIFNAKEIVTNQSIRLVRCLDRGQFSTTLLGFGRLDPQDKALSSEVVATAILIAKKIEAAGHDGAQYMPLSMVIAVSEISKQIQLLRLVDSTNKSISGLLNGFADILAHYSEANGEPSTWKQKLIQEFLQMIITSSGSSVRQSSWLDISTLSVVRSLVKFHGEKHLATAQRADCASACLAIHMQCHLLGRWVPYYMPNFVEALTVFGTVLSEDLHIAAINEELCLGIRFKDNRSRIGKAEGRVWLNEGRKWKQFKAKSIEDFEKAFSSSAQYDRKRLDELVVKDMFGGPVEVGYWGRILINRGCTAILVIFLSSMKVFPPPEDTLEPTLETLQIITKSLTVGYSSSSTQTVLIRLVDQISRQLHAHLMEQDPPPVQGAQKKEEEGDVIQEIPVGVTDDRGATGGAGASISNTTERSLNTTAKFILQMLQVLLDVVGTIAHPDLIEEAKKVVATICDEFIAFDVHAKAINVLEKV